MHHARPLIAAVNEKHAARRNAQAFRLLADAFYITATIAGLLALYVLAWILSGQDPFISFRAV